MQFFMYVVVVFVLVYVSEKRLHTCGCKKLQVVVLLILKAMPRSGMIAKCTHFELCCGAYALLFYCTRSTLVFFHFVMFVLCIDNLLLFVCHL